MLNNIWRYQPLVQPAKAEGRPGHLGEQEQGVGGGAWLRLWRTQPCVQPAKAECRLVHLGEQEGASVGAWLN